MTEGEKTWECKLYSKLLHFSASDLVFFSCIYFVCVSAYYSLQVFEEDHHFIAENEVIAAYKDGYWFRAEVIKCIKEGVVVSIYP